MNPPRDAGPGKPTSRPARRRAGRLVEEAMGEGSPTRRAALAREAIPSDDSNADAWGILAESEEDRAEAARLLGEAMVRAEAALGPEAVSAAKNEQKGDPAIPVWEDPAGLSYLRARAGLGLRLALLEGAARRKRRATCSAC